MTRKRRRLTVVLLCGLGLGTAAALSLNAMQDSLVFFYSPSDVVAKPVPAGRSFRIGGLVTPGSVARGVADGKPLVSFAVTDGAHTLAVSYAGILPDLFREGQGVVAEGRMRPDGGFAATTVLARHDETYMPPEVADALKRSGHWKEGEPPPPAATWNTLQTPAAGSARPAMPEPPPPAATWNTLAPQPARVN